MIGEWRQNGGGEEGEGKYGWRLWCSMGVVPFYIVFAWRKDAGAVILHARKLCPNQSAAFPLCVYNSNLIIRVDLLTFRAVDCLLGTRGIKPGV